MSDDLVDSVKQAIWNGWRDQKTHRFPQGSIDWIEVYFDMTAVARSVLAVLRTAGMVQIDREADAAYVHVSAAAVARTVEVGAYFRSVNVDLDADGGVVGVKFLALPEKPDSRHGSDIEQPQPETEQDELTRLRAAVAAVAEQAAWWMDHRHDHQMVWTQQGWGYEYAARDVRNILRDHGLLK